MRDISEISIRNEIKPGDIGYIIYLHGLLYAKEYGFDCSFESYVAVPLAEFVRSIKDRERIWIIEKNSVIAGSMAIVEHTNSKAQLRWLLLHPVIRRHGLGKKLVEEAIAFCRCCGYSSIFLWTVNLLRASAQLYKSKGFQLTQEKTHKIWGVKLTEQRYELKL